MRHVRVHGDAYALATGPVTTADVAAPAREPEFHSDCPRWIEAMSAAQLRIIVLLGCFAFWGVLGYSIYSVL